MCAYLVAGLCAAPALAGTPCAGEIAAFRDGSAYIWQERNVGPNVIDSSWRSLDRSDLTDPKTKRQVLTTLYAELNTLVKPYVASEVSPEVVALLGTAIRCAKDDIRTGERDRSKDSTAGLDRMFGPRAEAAFGVPIDLGDSL